MAWSTKEELYIQDVGFAGVMHGIHPLRAVHLWGHLTRKIIEVHAEAMGISKATAELIIKAEFEAGLAETEI